MPLKTRGGAGEVDAGEMLGLARAASPTGGSGAGDEVDHARRQAGLREQLHQVDAR